MCFVYDKSDDIASHQYPFNCIGPEHFRGYVQQGGFSILHPLYGKRPCYRVKHPVDCHSVGYASVCKVVNLIFH